ncbi:MAG: HAD hydrolase-like protein [Bryobacterales bacterium]|nr:HAD hydrolase-like protein [Bryobacterales bacterium]
MNCLLVFDMDGVLVEVTESYRETIQQTVEHFTGQRPSRTLIQDIKNQGGWNDDWSLSHKLIAEAGVRVEFQTVVDYFQSIFHGDGTNGLIMRERWIAADGLFERLSERFRLAVFTGRLKWEAEFTLRRFIPQVAFDPIVGMEEVSRLKPHPEGLLLIRSLHPGSGLYYVGDSVDDARCALAAGAPFIGIASPANPRHGELVRLFEEQKAIAVLDDINGLESVL